MKVPGGFCLGAVALLAVVCGGCAAVPPSGPPRTETTAIPPTVHPAEPPAPVEPRPAPPALVYVPEAPSPAGPLPTTEPGESPVTASIPPGLLSLADTRSAGFLTRGRLALLLVSAGVDQGEAPRDAPIMSDIVGHPAQGEIIRMVALGIMDAFPSHQFKPEAVVTRAELADSLQRALRCRGVMATAPAHQVIIPDVPVTNRYRNQIQAVVAAGLMTLAPGEGFQPAQPASGLEGWDAILRLNALLTGLRG